MWVDSRKGRRPSCSPCGCLPGEGSPFAEMPRSGRPLLNTTPAPSAPSTPSPPPQELARYADSAVCATQCQPEPVVPRRSVGQVWDVGLLCPAPSLTPPPHTRTHARPPFPSLFSSSSSPPSYPLSLTDS